MIDVREVADVPARAAVGRGGLSRRSRLGRPDDTDLDATAKKALVELATRAVGVGATAVHHEADRHALGSLRLEHARERLADRAGPESELIDVDGRAGRRDVVQHRREEVATLDVDLGRGGDRLVECECEVGAPNLPAEERLGSPREGVGRRRGHPRGVFRYRFLRQRRYRGLIVSLMPPNRSDRWLGGQGQEPS